MPLLTPRELAKQAADDLAAIGNAMPLWESEVRHQLGAIATARRMCEAAGATGVLPDALKSLNERGLYYHEALEELLSAMEGTD